MDATWEIACSPSWLVVRFRRLQRMVSWAIAGGGVRTASAVAWLGVKNAELPPELDPQAYLSAQLTRADLRGAVGLLTSRDLGAYVVHGARHGDVQARCVATVGLGNALRAGDAPTIQCGAGTINILCQTSLPLCELASLEALALASEARTCALLDAQVASRSSGLPATGTGTDCIVIASPFDAGAPAEAYAGKHTVVGHVIGAAVYGALRRGIAAWLAEQERRTVTA